VDLRFADPKFFGDLRFAGFKKTFARPPLVLTTVCTIEYKDFNNLVVPSR
jgi:hypothetical protein